MSSIYKIKKATRINDSTSTTTKTNGALIVDGGISSNENIILGGYLGITGTNNNIISLRVNATTGAYNFNLPTTVGGTSNGGDVLTSGGGGSTSMTWSTCTGTSNVVRSNGPTFGASTVTFGGPVTGITTLSTSGLLSANLGLTVSGANTSLTTLSTSGLITATGGLTSTAGSTTLGASTIGAITGTSATFSSTLGVTGSITGTSSGSSAVFGPSTLANTNITVRGSSSQSVDIAISAGGSYSTSASAGDTVIRSIGGALLLQAGGGTSAISIDSGNIVSFNDVVSFFSGIEVTGLIRGFLGLTVTGANTSLTTLSTSGVVSITDNTASTTTTTGALVIAGGIGVAKNIFIGSSISQASSASSGAYLNLNGSTFTDSSTAVSGTLSNWASSYFGTPTLSATNTSVKTTDASTLFIEGAPIPGTNETITNSYALNVSSGNSFFGGDLNIKSDINYSIASRNTTGGLNTDFSSGSKGSFTIRINGANASILQIYGNLTVGTGHPSFPDAPTFRQWLSTKNNIAYVRAIGENGRVISFKITSLILANGGTFGVAQYNAIPIATTANSNLWSVSGTSLTLTNVYNGLFSVGMVVNGTGITANTVITAITNIGGSGTVATLSISQTTASSQRNIITGTEPDARCNSWSVSGTTLTLTNVTYGFFYIGMVINAIGILANTTITAFISGNGSSGSVATLSLSQTTASNQTVLLTGATNIFCNDNFASGDYTITCYPIQNITTGDSLISNGFVGIGTNTPSVELHVNGSTAINRNLTVSGTTTGTSSGTSAVFGPSTLANTNITVRGSSSQSVDIAISAGGGGYSTSASAGDTVIRSNGGGKLLLQTGGGTSAISIDSSNNISINNNVTIGNVLNFTNTVNAVNIGLGFTTSAPLGIRDNGGNLINFYYISTLIGSITTNFSSTFYNTTSDKRLKTNIKPLINIFDKINEIKPVSYNFINNPSVKESGFIAQDIFKIFPYMRPKISDHTPCLCKNNPDIEPYCNKVDHENPVDKDGKPYTYGLDYGKFTPYLVRAVQELYETIKNQQETIDKLTQYLEK